jgi:hypothetical protein
MRGVLRRCCLSGHNVSHVLFFVLLGGFGVLSSHTNSLGISLPGW